MDPGFVGGAHFVSCSMRQGNAAAPVGCLDSAMENLSLADDEKRKKLITICGVPFMSHDVTSTRQGNTAAPIESLDSAMENLSLAVRILNNSMDPGVVCSEPFVSGNIISMRHGNAADSIEYMDSAMENLSLAEDVMDVENDVMEEDDRQGENGIRKYDFSVVGADDGIEYEFIDQDEGPDENLVPLMKGDPDSSFSSNAWTLVGYVNLEKYQNWADFLEGIHLMYLRRRRLVDQVFGVVTAQSCWPGHRMVFDDYNSLDCFHENETPWAVLREQLITMRLIPLA